MPNFEVDVEQVRRLVEMVERYGLAELTLEENGLSVTIKGYGAAAAPIHFVTAAPAPQAAVQIPPPAKDPEPMSLEPELEEELVEITAPLVGVFYRSPAPDAPPFIEVGDEIEIGQEIGLIEAMKVFSPIPSEVAGTVAAIPAENGKLVQHGDVLVLVRPAAA